MFQFYSLFSGSSGNCSLIQSENTKVLIDAGESAKKILEALHSIDVAPEDIDAIIITHEHSDHVKGLGTLSKKYSIPIFANSETLEAMPVQVNKISSEYINSFIVGEDFSLGDFKISPFSIPHDAANPCGFNIFHNSNKMSIATDIGHMEKNILDKLCYSSFVLLESNYDSNVLKCSSYPYQLKERIAGPLGHLSNDMAGKTISYLSNFGLKNVMLGHLSKENNFPELAYKTVVEQLIENKVSENSLQLSVAKRYEVSKVVNL